MSRVLVLGHDDARAALDPDALLTAVTTALVSTARGQASTPPRIAAFGPAGLLGAMPGYVPGLGMAGKLVTVFAVPGVEGRSSHRGVVALFDEHDGHLLALIDAGAQARAQLELLAHLGTDAEVVVASRDPDSAAAAAVFVEWPGAVERPPPAGAHELQGLPRDRVRMVGDVLGGVTTRTRGELTVFKSTGFAGLDVAASVALGSARREGLGSTVHL